MNTFVLKEEVDAELKRIQKENKQEIKSLISEFNETINSMKANSEKGKQLKLKIRKHEYSVGENTQLKLNGIDVYTGDEMKFQSGRKGVIASNNGSLVILTNAEVYKIDHFVEDLNTFKGYEGTVSFSKHFNELQLGEEIAKGRKGGEGFLVIPFGN